MEDRFCFLCGEPAEIERVSGKPWYRVECPSCGRYRITCDALVCLRKAKQSDKRAYLHPDYREDLEEGILIDYDGLQHLDR